VKVLKKVAVGNAKHLASLLAKQVVVLQIKNAKTVKKASNFYFVKFTNPKFRDKQNIKIC